MSDFISNNNKALLWNILSEKGFFDNIQSEKARSILLNDFENILATINSENQTVDLINKNKMFITKFIDNLNNNLSNNLNNNLNNNLDNNLYQPTVSFSDEVTEIYSKEDIHKKKRLDFEERLKQRQTDFSNIINKPRPDEIDFSQKKDEPIASEITDIINKLREERELDLNMIAEKQKKNETVKLKIQDTDDNKETNDTISTPNDAFDSLNKEGTVEGIDGATILDKDNTHTVNSPDNDINNNDTNDLSTNKNIKGVNSKDNIINLFENYNTHTRPNENNYDIKKELLQINEQIVNIKMRIDNLLKIIN